MAANSASSSQPEGIKGRVLDRASLFARFKYRNLALGSKDLPESKAKSLSQISHLLEKPNHSASS
jgi:hypothetical protein